MLIYLCALDSEEDKSRFQIIYEENYLRMYHVAFGILKRQAEAENAVHEAFLGIAENFKKYSRISCSEMTGLCVTIVKHKAIDIWRREQHLSEQELETFIFAEDSAEFSPEGVAEQKEQSALMQRALSELPEVLKETLVLKYYYEYGNREIAKILDIPVKTVEMRLYRGKAKLREILDEKI